MNNKEIERLVDRVLSPRGFEKKGLCWYRQMPTVLQMVDLQKSSYGGQFYCNLCFVPVGMHVEGLPKPKVHQCPIRMRLGSAFPEMKGRIDDLLNLENPDFDEATCSTGLRKIVNELVLPYFERLPGADELAAAIKRGEFRMGPVTLAAKKFLGIAEDT